MSAKGELIRCSIKPSCIVATITLLIGSLSGCGDSTLFTGEPEPVGGPALMRRLTESQYRATVADIFSPDIPISARFERGLRSEGLLAIGTSDAGISPFSVEQYDAAASSVATAVFSEQNRKHYVGCEPTSSTEFDAACASRFIETYAPRLLRRPLKPGEAERYVESANRAYGHLGDFYGGLKYALIGIMVSPEFLLRIEQTKPGASQYELSELDAYSKATRLSYFLTNSTPDLELLEAAREGDLGTRQGLARQVDRLLASPRFEQAVRALFTDILEFDLFDDLAKDPAIFPAFNSSVSADAQEQTLRTITDLLITQRGDYRDLFTTRETYLTRPLGIVYRVPVVTRNGWEKAQFSEKSLRRGIQSHISFLALHSHPGRSSPTLRGKAIREIFLCQEVPDPPPDVNFTAVQETTSTSMPTARDRLHAHNTQPACAGCHKITDPPGFTLEAFDGVGTSRTYENGVKIDTSGTLDGIPFTSPDEFAQALHDHPETPRCLVEKVYRYATGRDTMWEERAYMDWLVESFKRSDYRLPDLMRTIALSKNFFAIRPITGPIAEKSHATGTAEEPRS